MKRLNLIILVLTVIFSGQVHADIFEVSVTQITSQPPYLVKVAHCLTKKDTTSSESMRSFGSLETHVNGLTVRAHQTDDEGWLSIFDSQYHSEIRLWGENDFIQQKVKNVGVVVRRISDESEINDQIETCGGNQ